MRSTTFIVFIIFSSCTLYSDPPVDSGIRVYMDTPEIACRYDTGINNDFRNCGACGYVCPYTISDRCEMNECLCGNSPPCNPETEECRFGVCRPSDSMGEICEFDEECGSLNSGFGCIVGRCSRIDCVSEICDNLDNDCDGDIDGDSRGPLSRWCYDTETPIERLLYPPCQRGVQVCSRGSWSECSGSISPVSEIGTYGCDGIDNDCDGCIDGVMIAEECFAISNDGFDIVYAIDTSSSMSTEIDAVREATSAFTTRFSSEVSFRFGLVLVPGYTDGEVELVSPLVSFSTFNYVLSSTTFSFSGGQEPSYDSVYLLATESLPIGWRSNTIRIIILFTDEEGQSYLSPPITEGIMCASLTHGEVFAAVIKSINVPSFDRCATIFNLTSDPVEMTNSLATIIRDPCVSMP